MNTKKWVFEQKFSIEGALGMTENENYYIVRADRKLFFILKETMSISNVVDLGLDHEFGYKKIEAKGRACFVVVHSDESSDNDVFGDPDVAYLKSYSKDKLNWSYRLNGWTIGANYGGFFITEEENIFLMEKRNENFVIVILNSETGTEIQNKKIDNRYLNGPRGILGAKKSDLNKNKVYTVSYNNGMYENYLNESGKLSNKLIYRIEPEFIASNEDYIFCHGWKDDEPYLSIFLKREETIKEEILLPEEIDIKNIVVSPDNENLIFINTDFSISYFNLKEKKIVWELGNEKEAKIYQVFFNDENELNIVWSEPTTFLQVIDVSTKETIQEVTLEKGDFYFPFFKFGNNLFAKSFSELYHYSLE